MNTTNLFQSILQTSYNYFKKSTYMSQQIKKSSDENILCQLYRARSGDPRINYQENEIDSEVQDEPLSESNSNEQEDLDQPQYNQQQKQQNNNNSQIVQDANRFQQNTQSQNIINTQKISEQNQPISKNQNSVLEQIDFHKKESSLEQNIIEQNQQVNKEDQMEQPQLSNKIQSSISGKQAYIGELTKSDLCDLAKQKSSIIQQEKNPYEIFQQYYQHVVEGININQSIKMYFLTLIQHQEDESYFQHYIEHNVLNTVLQVIKRQKYSSEIIKAVFQSMELLLRGLHKEDQCIYFTLTIAKSGLLQENFQFIQEQDAAYYANFLKILARKINQDEKYLSVFINAKDPDFPLMKNLLRFHNTSDIILHTSSKLAIMELCNNQHPLVKKYILNFPFVIFYPCYVEPIATYLQQLIENQEESQEMNIEENLKNSIKFMEDFSGNKSREFIDMYTNSFFYLVGKNYYKAFENKTHQVKLLKILHNLILPEITVLKIRISFQQIFKRTFTKQMLNYFKAKIEHLNPNYWLLDQSKTQIKKHCEEVIFKDEEAKLQTRGSWIGTMYSYIPKTNSNWFYHQLKKLSEIIGFGIDLNKPINHDLYNFNSFLAIIESEEIKKFQNPLFANLVHKQENQEVLYWFLKVATDLNCIDEESLPTILHQVSRCTSLSVVRQFYEAVLKNNLTFAENQYTSHHYSEITQKLIYTVLTEGWKSFKIKAKIPKLMEYSQDIFRDIECDIVYFTALRHILGTPNSTCSQFNDALIDQLDNEYKQIKVKCKLTNSQGQDIFLILDGQYIKLQSQQEQVLTKDALLLRDFAFYQQELTFQIVDKVHEGAKQNFRIYFPQQPIRQFIGRQVKWRKQSSMNIQLELKTLKFLQV